ncbi:LacI family DNA-binding transcriptional regulator [Chitinophagaceae bacterium LWZ2-11]
MKQEVTIYDIAKELNISPATVSRALKNHPAISNATKKKIQDLAKQKGYRSNIFAGNLRKQKTNTIGVIIHELNSHFTTSVLAGIEKVTTAAGYDLIIGHSSETYKKEVANAHNLFHKRVDGLIASLSYDTKDTAHFDPFIEKGIPVVFFDRVEDSVVSTKVVIDNFKAGYDATTHLIQQGCKRIVHVTASLQRNVYSDRFKGYKQALTNHKINFSPKHLIINDLSEKAAIETAKQIMKMQPLPDAVFITNDFCAAICMKTMLEAGIRVPQDIAFVGFNNDVISTIVEPKLTTINYPGMQMGEIAGKNLIEQLTDKHTGVTDKVIITSELIIRASSLKKG